MGTKRKRVIMEAGSLLNPIYRYILKMNFVANPVDTHGTRLLRYDLGYLETYHIRFRI
jgi:hypothetical protein